MKNPNLLITLAIVGAIAAPLAVQAHESANSAYNCATGAGGTPGAYQARDWGDENTSSPTYIMDSEITYGIRAQLASSHSRDLRRVVVCTEGNGVVVLSGRVRHDENEGRAVAIARATNGVSSVDDEITVKRN
jgi:osmotically-inducible protein OsmY